MLPSCDAFIIGAAKSVVGVGVGATKATYDIGKPIVTGVTRLGWDVTRFTAAVVGTLAFTVPLKIGGALLGVKSQREKMIVNKVRNKLYQVQNQQYKPRLAAAKARSNYIRLRGN